MFIKLFTHKNFSLFCITAFLCVAVNKIFGQQLTHTDSLKILNKVIITGYKKQNTFTTAVPVQVLNHETLQQLNAESIGGAAQYFSGVLIKDYGGIGGLKTISVRSLGASSTGVMYDGITVADAQSGQVDLSKFSSTFVQSLELDQTNPQQMLLPARAYSSSSILAVTTNTFNTTNFTQQKWQAGIDEGSFGLWQANVGIYSPISKTVVISANAEAITDKGNYPFYNSNGKYSQNLYRINSNIQSLQSEINIVKQFADSSLWQTKVWEYSSSRGLPGAIIDFNDSSIQSFGQHLWDEDFFTQSRYQKKISTTTSLLVSAKYSSLFARYVDPSYQNNMNGINYTYNQHEIYASAALSHQFGKNISMAIASDIAFTTLSSDMPEFAFPSRTQLWNSFSIQYSKTHWQINGSLLNTNVTDTTKLGTPEINQNKTTPTISASYKTHIESPFLFRFFYKDIFRMPTFNDVYYTTSTALNHKLSPEYSSQYNVGITYTKLFASWLKQFNISIDAYYNNIKNKIIAYPSSNLFIWTVKNLGKVEIKGIDITSEANGKVSSKINWSTRIAYTLQQAWDLTDPSFLTYKNEIAYTPNSSGSAIVALNYKNWNAGYSLLFSGYRNTNGENIPSEELPGWVTHDLFVSRTFKLNKLKADIKASLNNIFNEMYYVVDNYPMPGRSYKISITFNNL